VAASTSSGGTGREPPVRRGMPWAGPGGDAHPVVGAAEPGGDLPGGQPLPDVEVGELLGGQGGQRHPPVGAAAGRPQRNAGCDDRGPDPAITGAERSSDLAQGAAFLDVEPVQHGRVRSRDRRSDRRGGPVTPALRSASATVAADRPARVAISATVRPSSSRQPRSRSTVQPGTGCAAGADGQPGGVDAGSCPVRTVAERGADSRQAPSLVPVEAHHVGNLHWGQGWTSPGPRLGWEGRRGGAACGRRWGCSRCGRRSGPGTVLARTSRPGPPDRPGQGSARRRRGAAGCRGPGAGLGRTGWTRRSRWRCPERYGVARRTGGAATRR